MIEFLLRRRRKSLAKSALGADFVVAAWTATKTAYIGYGS